MLPAPTNNENDKGALLTVISLTILAVITGGRLYAMTAYYLEKAANGALSLLFEIIR